MPAYGVAICIFAPTDDFIWAAGLLMLCGAGQIACNATNNILPQTIVPDAVRGRVLSVLLLNKGLVQLGTAAVARLAALIGLRWALLMSGGVVVLSACIVLVLAPTIRRLRT